MNQIRLNTILTPKEVKKHKIRGRGSGSCKGGKSGRGSDGQKARSGDNKPKTEGGQYPSYLRWNKVGFNRIRKQKIHIVKTSTLDYIAKKLNTTNLTLEQIKSYFKLKKEKVKILFDQKNQYCLESESNYASKKVVEFLKVKLL